MKVTKKVLMIVSNVFLVLTLFLMVPLTASAETSGTRTNPYNAYENHVVTLQEYSFDSVRTIGIQLMECIDGPVANSIVTSENMFNEVPEAGEKWVLLRFHFQYISSSKGDTDLLEATDVLYATTGSCNFFNSTATTSLKIMDTATLSGNYMDQFDVDIYPGGEADVWYGILIPESEEYLTFRIPTSPTTTAWFTSNPLATGEQTSTVTPTPEVTQTPAEPAEVPIPEAEINQEVASLYIGQKLTLEVSNYDERIEWISTDENIVTVTEQGLVTAIAKGKASIIATVGDTDLMCTITVKSPKISKSSLSLYTGGKEKISIKGATGKIAWSSSNSKIAKVTSSGTIYGLKKGTATITATVGKTKYTCKVTVKNPTLSKTKLSINAGSKIKLTVNGGMGKIKWASSNSKIASVSKTGYVSGVKEGTATITATIDGIKLTCRVTVTPLDIKSRISAPTNDQWLEFGWERDSVDGIKFCWTADNLSKKTINYYTVTLHFENPVGDPAYDEITGLSYKTIKYVGPVDPGESLVIYTNIGYLPTVSKITVGEITLEYSDKTKETGWYGYYTTDEY